ncbi:MAG: hypothetical protein KGJ37_05175 [Verrucomicrobiota bacterium]|nr:hypothetical protein [Verrucomicrobiota bacterium]
MRQRLQLILLLSAWFMATGSQWDLVQTFAWGRMIVRYARVMPLSDAVRLTFTPTNLCGICELVKEAKQQEDHAPNLAKKDFGKIVLVLLPAPVVIAPTNILDEWRRNDAAALSAERASPPTPPPRLGAV